MTWCCILVLPLLEDKMLSAVKAVNPSIKFHPLVY
jgi:hypothetical protein